MNSEAGGGPSFELPAQQHEQVEKSTEQDRVVEQQRPATQEAGVGKRAPQPGSTAVDLPAVAPVPAAPAVQHDDQSAAAGPVSPSTADLQAADADLIEKEWIQRAKSIVAKTAEDPRKQKDEMSRVKADYIKKRYNKTIKTDETAVA